MRSMSRNLVKETACDVFATDYYVVNEGIISSSFSFVQNAITEMIHRRVLDETLSSSFNRWSPSDLFMQVLFKKTVKDSGFIMLVTTFVRQRAINAGEEELKREAQVTRKILSPPDHSLSASAEAVSDKASRARCSRLKCRDREDRIYRDSLEALR